MATKKRQRLSRAQKAKRLEQAVRVLVIGTLQSLAELKNAGRLSGTRLSQKLKTLAIEVLDVERERMADELASILADYPYSTYEDLESLESRCRRGEV